MKTIESLGDLKGKRVLVRSDFNVPLDADKNITDDGVSRLLCPPCVPCSTPVPR